MMNYKPLTAEEERRVFGDDGKQEAIRIYYETWLMTDRRYTEEIACEATNDDEYLGTVFELLNTNLEDQSDAWKARQLEKLINQMHAAGRIVAGGVMEE